MTTVAEKAIHTKTIVNGPSKFNLAVSLFHGDYAERVPVRFMVCNDNHVGEGPISVLITSIKQVGDEFNDWEFGGEGIGWAFNNCNYQHTVSGCFNTQTRTGVLHLTPVI